MNNEMLKTIDEDKLAGVAGGGPIGEFVGGLVGAAVDLGVDLAVSRVTGAADAWRNYVNKVGALLGK